MLQVHLLKLCLTRTHGVRKKPAGSVPGTASQPAWLEAVSVNLTTLVLASPRSRVILGLLDILVDIGVHAEKEVIQ